MLIDSVHFTEGASFQNLVVYSASTFSATPATGELAYINSTSAGHNIGLYFYDGHTWQRLNTPANPIIAAQVWVEVAGDDRSGVVGDPAKPFATINAALDALPAAGGVIYLGIGEFAPIADDYQGTTTPDPASKLKSNLKIIGAKKPTLDNSTAPTKLQGGSIIKGPLVFHSTRMNVTIASLGIDSGAAVCSALYGGADQEGLLFANISRTIGLAPASGIQILDVVTLAKSATSLTYSCLVENVIHPRVLGLQSYFGFSGVAIKAIGGIFSDLQSFGHSMAPVYFKDDSYARCYGCIASNLSVGALGANDTPNGVYFTTGSDADLDHITINGLQTLNVACDIKVDTLGSGITRNVQINGFQGDQSLRVSTTNIDGTTFTINGTPLQGVVVLSDALTINTDASKGSGIFSVVLTGTDRELANPTNLVNGKTYIWEIIQDTVGGKTISRYGTMFTFPGATLPIQSSAGDAVDLLMATYDGVKLRCTYNKAFA